MQSMTFHNMSTFMDFYSCMYFQEFGLCFCVSACVVLFTFDGFLVGMKCADVIIAHQAHTFLMKESGPGWALGAARRMWEQKLVAGL